MSDFSSRLQNLNPDQRKAVETIQGPVLVVAGPGTGKTQILAMRIANILKQTDVKASNILCLTFTESGVLAMRKRLQQIIGTEAYYVRIHTFHSFSNEVIQTFPEKFAFARELVQLDDLNKIKILRSILDTYREDAQAQLVPFFNKYQYQSDIANSIQVLKREGVSVEQFAEIVAAEQENLEATYEVNKKTGKPKAAWLTAEKNTKRLSELAEIYGAYQAALAEQGVYDYEDMIMFVLQKFAEDDELLAFYQERFLYILVDEYQDTNGSQNKLLQLLGSFDPSPNIFAVGDDDQAIYRFQGASVENLLFFSQQFENVTTIPITTNYRSSQLVLDLAGSVIRHNKARLTNIIPDLNKDLIAGLPIPNHKAEVIELTTQDKENFFLISKIKQLHESGVAYSDMAILYRRHRDAEDIAEALLKSQIPIKLSAGSNALDEMVVQQLIKLLQVVQYQVANRDALLFEVLFYKYLALPRLDVFKLTRHASDKKISLFEAMLDTKLHADLNLDARDQVLALANRIIDWHQEAANMSLLQFIEHVASQSGYMDYLFSSERTLEDINSANSFFNYVRQLNRMNKQARLADLLADLRLLQENSLSVSEQRLDLEEDGVQMMTAHSAKGLEFKYVFLPKFYSGNWGDYKRREIIKLPSSVFAWGLEDRASKISLDLTDDDLEDERRLLFVALTRAKEQLFISHATEYVSGQSTKQVAPSQFLLELDSNDINRLDPAPYEEVETSMIRLQLQPVIDMNYSEKEEKYLRTLVEKFKLSPSALNEYLECPLRFKFNRLLKVPQPQLKILSLGTSIHFALEHFMRKLKVEGVEDREYLLWLFEQQLERELISQEEKGESLAEGKQLLNDYFENYKGTFIAPLEVEYGFYGREMMLSLPGIEPVPLSGKIDKITWVEEEHYMVKVTDYKTSSPKSANEIMGLTKNSDGSIYRQLTFYKLLSEIDDNFRPGKNLPKYQIAEAEVDFLKPSSTGSFKREVFNISTDDVTALKQTIGEVMTHIRELKFGGDEKYPLCGECEYCQLMQDR